MTQFSRRQTLSFLGGASTLSLMRSKIVSAQQLTGTIEADVLIIGSGASGAAVAWRLSQAGINVVCLEQGDWQDYAEAPATKPDWEIIRQRSWNPNPNVRGLAADYPVSDDDSAIKPLMFNGVGGSTIMWSCHAPRFHPSDFRTNTLDGVGTDWPLTYEDLEPYYDLNDEISGVAGVNGDPAYPPRSPRQTPPVPLGPGGQKLVKGFEGLGWHWWPCDVQINTEPYGEGRGECNHCGPCELGCPFGAKGSTDFTYWPAALEAGAQLITGARVFEIETDANGRATGAAFYDKAGQARRAKADVVIVAANGIGTPRLLLMSESKAHPNGLANGSDMVGRNLMFHPVAVATGVFDEAMDGYRGITACILASHEFYETDPSRDFKRGYMFQALRSVGPLMTALGGYGVPIPWGERHHTRFEEAFNRTTTLAVVAEDLANPENRVTLDRTVTDSSGLPAPHVRYVLDDNAKAMLNHGLGKAEEVFQAAGASEIHTIPYLDQAGFHLMGTARMGDDPDSSVVNAFGQAHDVDNLLIVDGSVFVTAAAVNPTVTIQALALRAADRLIETRNG